MQLRIPHVWLLVVPLLLTFVGATSNQAVLYANWGKFPVMVNERQLKDMRGSAFDGFAFPFYSAVTSSDMGDDGQFLDDIHSVMGHNSRLKWLADWINLKTEICSPGDLLIWLGDWLFGFTPLIWLTLLIKELNEA